MANQINWGDQYCKSNWGDQSNKLAVPEFPEGCYLIKVDCNSSNFNHLSNFKRWHISFGFYSRPKSL